MFPQELKQQSNYIWDIIIVLLNELMFIPIGLQLPVMDTIDKTLMITYIGYTFTITMAALVLRTARVFLPLCLVLTLALFKSLTCEIKSK